MPTTPSGGYSCQSKTIWRPSVRASPFGSSSASLVIETRALWPLLSLGNSSPVDISADAALQAADAQVSGGTSAVAEAEEFLRDILAAGPIPQKEVKDAAGGHGLAWRTVQRAKARLRVRATKDGMDGGWSWSLPKDANDDEERHPLRMATFGQVGALQDDDLEIPGFLRRSVA